MKKLLLLFALIFLVCPFSGHAQTSVTGTVMEAPFAARPAVCASGDLFFATDIYILYQCGPSNTWSLTTGGQFGYASNASASGALTLNAASNFFYDYTLSGNVTSMTVSSVGQANGTIYGVQFCQPSGGGTYNYTVVWPGNFNNPPTPVFTGQGACTSAFFKLNGSGSWDNASFNAFYQTLQQNNVDVPKQKKTNFLAPFTVVDNPSNFSSDVAFPPCVGVGVSHSVGAVPDPGAATHSPLYYLDETCGWSAVPTAGGNAAIKPAVADGIQYVTLEGNDANDGLSWGTAKATVYASLLALPNGTSSPPTAGDGVVFISGANIPYGGPLNPNGGWYMFGSTDPGYAGGVSGWMRAPADGGTVTVECDVPMVGLIHDHSAACQEYWGAHTDNVHPAIWWNGFSGQAKLRKVTFNYEASIYKLGIDSANNRATGGLSSVWLDQDGGNMGSCYQGIGAGPAVDIGGASFWININDGAYSGCSTQDYSITAISRFSNVVTVTLNHSATGDITAGATNYIIIRNVSDPMFNGAYVITSASGTSLTYAQNGPNVSSSGGQAFPYGAAAIGINSGTGSGSGHIYVNNTADTNGAVWAQGGFNGVGLTVNSLDYEGNGFPDMSVVELLPTISGGDTTIYINDVQLADNSVPICGVESLGSGNVSVANTTTCGSVETFHGEINGSVSLLRQGGGGTYNTRFFAGNIDAGRRMFSPYAVRYPNLVGSPTTWGVSPMIITTGQVAPDGTNNAALVSNSSGGQGHLFFNNTSGPSPQLGSFYVFGVWLKGTSVPKPVFTLNENGVGSGDYCQGTYLSGTGSSEQGTQISYAPLSGDGGWNWYSGVCKIIANPSAGYQIFEVRMNNGTSLTAYGPVLAVVPAGAISDNEAWELANNLSSYPINATNGDVSMFPGQRFLMSVPGSNFMYKHQGAPTADRTITWPDVSGTVAEFTGSITGGNNVCASGTLGLITTIGCTGGGSAPTGPTNAIQTQGGGGVFANVPVPIGPDNVFQLLGSASVGGVGTPAAFKPAGRSTRRVTINTDTVLKADRAQQDWYTFSGTVNVSISAPSTTDFTNWVMNSKTDSGTTVVWTPTAGLINGGVTWTQNPSCIATWSTSDNVNLDAICIGGSASVTGSGTNGSLTKWTGAGSVGNADLTGDVTTSGTVATTIAANAVTAAKTAVVLTRRVCDIGIGDTSSAIVITNAQLGPQKRGCFLPAASTIVELDVDADAGTPNVIVGYRNPAGTLVNIVSGALATGAAGVNACSNTGGTTGIDGVTSCSATLQNTSVAAGGFLELVSGTAGGTAKWMTIHVTYTIN